MLWIESQYAKMVGSRLDHFKVQKARPFVANCRCPFCGDSQRHKRKARGYIFERGQHLFYYCHNCAVSLLFKTFLEKIDPELGKEMALELFRAGVTGTPKDDESRFVSEVPEKTSPGMTPSSLLDFLVPAAGNPVAVKYLEERKIPKLFWYAIYFTDDFPAYVHSAFPDKAISEPPCCRIVIPFTAPRDNKIVGVCARLVPDTGSVLNKRYYSISQPGYPKLWQSPLLDPKKTVYVTEGVFDAFFLPNGAAMLGSDVGTAVLRSLFDDFVYIFDNEKRNPQIVHQMEKKIKEGCKIVIWPSDNPYKDVNDMVLNGFLPQVEKNVKQGLAAELAVRAWKRTA